MLATMLLPTQDMQTSTLAEHKVELLLAVVSMSQLQFAEYKCTGVQQQKQQ